MGEPSFDSPDTEELTARFEVVHKKSSATSHGSRRKRRSYRTMGRRVNYSETGKMLKHDDGVASKLILVFDSESEEILLVLEC